MQNTIEFEQGFNFRWVNAAGIFLLGLVIAIVVGGVSGWIDTLITAFSIRGLVLYIVANIGAFYFLVDFALDGLGRLHFRILGLVAAVAVSICFLVGSEFAGYMVLRQNLRERLNTELAQNSIPADQVNIEQTIDNFLLSNFKLPGFEGYLLVRITSDLTVIAIRVVTALLVAFFTWRNVFAKPVCDACGRWYGKSDFMGTLTEAENQSFTALVKAGSMHAAGQMLRTDYFSYPRIQISMRSCKQPALHDSILDIYRFLTSGMKKQQSTQHLFSVKISAVQREMFLRGKDTSEAVDRDEEADIESGLEEDLETDLEPSAED